MKKTNLFFILLIIIELVLLIGFSFKTCYWSTPCSTPDFFHPFGKDSGEFCIQMVALGICSIEYLMSYLLILTIAVYSIYLIYSKLKRNKR